MFTKEYKKELFDLLRTNAHMQKAFDMLRKQSKVVSYIIIKDFQTKKSLSIMKKGLELLGIKNRKSISKIVGLIKNKTANKEDIKFGEINGKYWVYIFPLTMDGKTYAFTICFSTDIITTTHLECFAFSLKIVFENIYKSAELSKISDSIKPRAIALSTVHTLHRLITSSLNLDELLPRIAHLSIQVLRANRCSIKLLNDSKKILISKTTIDLRKHKKISLRNLPVGQGVPGRAIKLEKILRARNYISIPLIDEEAIGVITVYDKIDKKPFSEFDVEIFRTLAEQSVVAIKNAQLYEEQRNFIISIMQTLAKVLEHKKNEYRIKNPIYTELNLRIGKIMALNSEELKTLEIASLLHDTGQLSLPKTILSKKSRLTKKEFALIKSQPKKTASVFKNFNSLKPVMPILLHQHEKYDGTGYPKGLRGNEIPLASRIMAVVAAFNSMVGKRAYKKRKTIIEAIAEIEKNSGTQFDPTIVSVFIKTVNTASFKKLLGERLK